MKNSEQFLDIDFKKAWTISGIIIILDIISFILWPFLKMKLYYIPEKLLSLVLLYIPNIILSTINIIIVILLLKNLEIKKGWIIVLSIFSLILGIFFPLVNSLPIVTLTAITSEKKSNIYMWIFGIVLILFQIIATPLGIVMMKSLSLLVGLDFSLTSSGGLLIFNFIYCIIYCYFLYKPLITLYAVLLGNKKSYRFYLLLTPDIIVIMFFVFGLILCGLY